jgi:hypothetical protein
MPNESPYIVANQPAATLKSVVALLDVLGFLDAMKNAFSTNTDAKLLVDFRSALSAAYKDFEEKTSIKGSDFCVKAFTDNIVIGQPITFDDAESELGSVLLSLREYQLEMAIRGFFVRGGVAIGALYMDDEIVYGDALIEAYSAEQNVARDPRIVMAKSAQSYIAEQFKFYTEPAEAPHNQVLLRDVDGQLFLNYLGATYDWEPENPIFSKLDQHRAAVESKLKEFTDRPAIWSKYAWVANYHNFVCQEQGARFLQYKIDPKLLRQQPSRIY